MTDGRAEKQLLGVVGLGLVGGSIARALVAEGIEVMGYDQLPETRRLAEGAGVQVAEPERIASSCELVVIALPPDDVPAEVERMICAGAPAVTDTASIKSPVFEQLRLRPEERLRFVGSHPMAGNQGSGWDSSDPGLLAGATWAICAPVAPELEAFLRVCSLADALGCETVAATPEDHDRAVSVSSHSVQMIQQALAARFTEEQSLPARLSGPGLRDSTRLAESPWEGLWEEIAFSRPELLAESIRAFEEELASMRRAIEDGDSEAARMIWRQGALGRERITASRWATERRFRRISYPLGLWWESLLDLGRSGCGFRLPRVEDGALLVVERSV